MNVGETTKEAELEKKIVLSQSSYVIHIGESMEIIPQIYPDSKLKGSWTIEGEKDIVSVEQNTFSAKKRGRGDSTLYA